MDPRLLYPVPSGTHMVGVYQRLTKWLALKGDLSSRDGAGGTLPSPESIRAFPGDPEVSSGLTAKREGRLPCLGFWYQLSPPRESSHPNPALSLTQVMTSSIVLRYTKKQQLGTWASAPKQ